MSKSYIENDKNIANSKNEIIHNYKTVDRNSNQQQRNEKLKKNDEEHNSANQLANKIHSSVQSEEGKGDNKLSSTSTTSSTDESEMFEVLRIDFKPIPGVDDDPVSQNKCWEYWKLVENVKSNSTNK